jgi:hypothetical protein
MIVLTINFRYIETHLPNKPSRKLKPKEAEKEDVATGETKLSVHAALALRLS